jgi:hypothetical protein
MLTHGIESTLIGRRGRPDGLVGARAEVERVPVRILPRDRLHAGVSATASPGNQCDKRVTFAEQGRRARRLLCPSSAGNVPEDTPEGRFRRARR